MSLWTAFGSTYPLVLASKRSSTFFTVPIGQDVKKYFQATRFLARIDSGVSSGVGRGGTISAILFLYASRSCHLLFACAVRSSEISDRMGGRAENILGSFGFWCSESSSIIFATFCHTIAPRAKASWVYVSKMLVWACGEFLGSIEEFMNTFIVHIFSHLQANIRNL